MKIVELRFKNLNSLVGEWLIDFTAPEYISDGIFAITGATGAGKTTILDAICLALYGETPRLGKITKSSNEIMSRQTAECMAEICFETQEGYFRCTWSQHRSRKKADGDLQATKHEISNATTGKILESKMKDVAAVIETKIGMDFKQFTRSILLAQGGFAAFLNAKADERAPILEQITGTEIYSLISQKVHEKKNEELKKLDLFQNELSNINLLSEETIQNKKILLEENLVTEAKLEEDLEKLNKSLNQLENIHKLENELTKIKLEIEETKIEDENFRPLREKLEKAKLAQEFEADYETLKSLEEQEAEQTDKLKYLEKQLSDYDLKLKKTQRLELENFSQRIKFRERIFELNKNNLEILKQNLIQAQEYLANNITDEKLVSELTAIKESFSYYQKSQTELEKKSLKLKSLETQLSEHRRLYACSAASLKEKTQEQTNIAQLLMETEDSYINLSQEKALLISEKLKLVRETESILKELLKSLETEKLLFTKISNLEEERKNLEDAKPCPLCGSIEHPYAKGNLPVQEELDKKLSETKNKLTVIQEEILKLEIEKKGTEKDLEQLNKVIDSKEDLKLESKLSSIPNLEKLSKDINTLKIKLAEILSKKNKLLEEIDRENQKLNTLKQEGIKISSELDSETKSLSELDKTLSKETELLKRRIETFNTTPNISTTMFSHQEIVDILNKLQLKLDNYEKHSRIKSESELLIEKLESENKNIQEFISSLSGEEIYQKALSIKLTESFPDKPSDLTTTIERLDKEYKNILSLRQDSEKETYSIQANISSLKENLKQLGEKTSEKKQKFISNILNALGLKSFTTDDYKKILLEKSEREYLGSKSEAIKERKIRLEITKTNLESSLRTEKQIQSCEKAREELVSEKNTILENKRELLEEIGSIKKELEHNAEARTKFNEKMTYIEAQKKECEGFDKLHLLIGSADGKKYRNFVQGLSFQMVISHANKQLQEMSDRYLLIMDKDLPLELNVIDNYQAGEIRSTKNLSGGESFIISLALALGLSKIVSSSVRVDSLFLDEGFGTLDTEALEVALETLSNLKQTGKLIGIISHMEALKERIPSQIKVESISGGRSILSGAGCRKIGLGKQPQAN